MSEAEHPPHSLTSSSHDSILRTINIWSIMFAVGVGCGIGWTGFWPVVKIALLWPFMLGWEVAKFLLSKGW